MTSEKIYISKLCNAFYPGAQVNFERLPTNSIDAVERFKRRHGGLWVGGRLVITNEEIQFTPNALNVAVHMNVTAMIIPLGFVNSVSWIFGFFTGIILIVSKKGEYRFRCFGAKGIVRKLESLIKRA